MGWSTQRTIILVCLVTLLAVTPAKSSSHTQTTLNETQTVNTVSTQNTTSSASQTHRPTEELTAPPVGEGERDAGICPCPGLETTFVCNCTAPRGVIESPTFTGSKVELSYYIEAEEESSLLVIYFTKADVSLSSSICTLTFGEVKYSDNKQLPTDIVEYMDTATPIRAYGYFPACKFKLNYAVYPPNWIIENITDTEGFLEPPVDNVTGAFNYLPNAQYLWIFRPNVPVSKFNFTFNLLDLGAPSNVIHGSNKVNQSQGDFLLIGPGVEVLGGSEIMFYGQREAEKIRQVVTVGHQSHIFFNSYANSFNATGFNISYAAEEIEETTTVVSTTGNPLPPENLKIYTVTAINGIRNGNNNINATIDYFKEMIADMATEYLHLKDGNDSVIIIPQQVVVEDARGCRLHCVLDTCVSFNFSVAARYPNGSWIFNTSRLNNMLATKEVLDNLDKNCEICKEPERNMGMYIGVPVAIVVIACIVSMAFWFFGARDHQDDAKLKYEQEIADRRDDNRRRSSGDVSILGLGGGSIASRATLSSRRFTMPFPKAKKTEDEGDDVDAVDISGYKEYDPDVGRIDPSSFGIHKDILSDRKDVTHFTNDAFVDDDDDETTVFRRERDQKPETMAAGTDSEDSDGGAVSFEPRKKKNTSATPVTATVEVHSPEHLSLQRFSASSGNSETAL